MRQCETVLDKPFIKTTLDSVTSRKFVIEVVVQKEIDNQTYTA